MTAHIKPIRVAVTPEFPDGIGYEVSRILPNWASAQAGASALSNVNPEAFAPYTPGLCAGEPVDAPERVSGFPSGGGESIAGKTFQFYEDPWPSDATARVYPPPCGGPPSGYAEATAGEVLAHAQHEAATDGDDCSSTTCLLTRGAGD